MPVLTRRAVGLVEEVGHLLLGLVQRGTDDVRRRLVVVDLQDVLAEIGLDDRQPRGLDRVIERRFFGNHRFRLDDLRHAMLRGDLQDQRVDVGRRFREQHRRAPRGRRSARRSRARRRDSRAHGCGSSCQPRESPRNRRARRATPSACRRTWPACFVRLRCSRSSLRLACARSLKCIEATCMATSDVRRPLARSGRTIPREHLGDVQHLGLAVTQPAEPAFDVQHAAEIAEHHGVGAARRDVPALVVRETRRDLAELDRRTCRRSRSTFRIPPSPRPKGPRPWRGACAAAPWCPFRAARRSSRGRSRGRRSGPERDRASNR